MTYCLGIKVKEGLLAIADTRITSGTETTNAKKISVLQSGNNKLFLMTSGLRSIRDKAVTYFEEILDGPTLPFTKMYQAVNAFGEQLRRVKHEDQEALMTSGLVFNLFSIVGGQLEDDKEHKLFLLYPEGNWIEIGQATPFTIIGNSGYGKPILNRVINFESPLNVALKTGLLSFDSTRVSANDVGFPIDIVIFQQHNGELIEKRLYEQDISNITSRWAAELKKVIDKIPQDWISNLIELDKIPVDQ
ncbi:peptidase [Membranihabitans marinus]|uniref:peptidase n=1 Tax=Membranihabitans marinus TaxID=1227546 RepID=UPI001F2986DB|nr:peptidase [Membranihabitans marinus]